MKYQLIQIDPLQRLSEFPDPGMGFPGVLNLPDDRTPPELPNGYSYVPVVIRPTFDAATQKAEPTLTSTEDGWTIIDLTEAEIDDRQKPVIKSIKAWQAKAALANAGFLTAAEAAIDGMADGLEKTIIKSAWDNNANFKRDSAAIASLAVVIGLTEEQIDELFIFANSLDV